MKRIAIIGGGIAGLASAGEIARLARAGHEVEATLFESSGRLGGIVETVHEQGFTIELGPDAWVSEKPWARDLAVELGLEDELLPSNDATRKTYILQGGKLEPIPDGMRLMVPSNLNALNASGLFSASAKQAYRDEISRGAELKSTAPTNDESVASFVRRHFGQEVLQTIAAPLLSGVLGGDVEHLSAHAVLAPFVKMEREFGSLITALQHRSTTEKNIPIFTTLHPGLGTLIDRIAADIPASWIQRNTTVTAISEVTDGWSIQTSPEAKYLHFNDVHVATPVQVARELIRPLDREAASLMEMRASSAIIVAFGLPDSSALTIPPGFGFLVPPGSASRLLACTFVDQKFNGRLPPATTKKTSPRLLRAFFGGDGADALLARTDPELRSLARHELTSILGPLPCASIEIVRRWPLSLPQYPVGHLDTIARLEDRIAALPGLALLGNGYRGVGLPDLIRDARTAAQASVLRV